MMLFSLKHSRYFSRTAALNVARGAALCCVVPLALATGPAAASQTVAINGAGSTFVGPLMLGGWIPGYTGMNSSVHINYALTGSGQGISLWTAGKTDFAASDALLKPAQEKAASERCYSTVTHIPVTIGAVAIIYNVPGIPSGLRLNAQAVSDIFSGHIHSWSDKEITQLNPHMSLPSQSIQVVHRSDGSGTTYILTHYLAAVSSSWKSQVGSGSTVAWPVGLGAKGSAGVAAQVSRTHGSISYVDLAYAVKNHLSYANVENASGMFVTPSVASASAAAQSFSAMLPSNLQQVIVNSPAAAAYPISGYSYIFLCGTQSGAKGRALVAFVRYAVTTGQNAATSRYYAPLPTSVRNKDLDALRAIKVS